MKSKDKTQPDRRATRKKPIVQTSRTRQGGASPRPKTSARRSEEAAFRTSEAKFRRLFETAQDGIILLDAQTGEITDTNPYIEKLLGYSHRELAGKKLWEIGPFKDTFSSHETFRELQRKGYIRYENLPLETKDGHRCEVEFISNVYRVGNQKVVQCYVRDITERARIGYALGVSEARYRSLFENMLDGFAYCQMIYQEGQPVDFIYLDVNPAFEKLTGLKNVVGKKVTEVIPGIKESDPALFEIYGRVALTGRPEKFHMFVESLGIWFSISVYSTQKEYFTAVFENITERARAEEALREGEERFRSIFENTTIGLYRTTPEGRILLANPTLIHMLGYETFEDLAHRDLEESGFEPQYSRKEFRQQVESKGEIRGLEAAWKKKDGITIFVRESARAFRNEDGQVLYYEGTVEDITERKQVEAALRESEERFRKVFDEGPIGMALADKQYHFIRANPTFCQLLGYSEEELTKLTFKEITHPEDLDSSVNNVRNLEKRKLPVFKTEKRYVTKNKGVLWGALTLSTVLDPEGEFQFFLVMIENITQRRQAEESLHESEERYRSIFENTGLGAFESTPEGKIIRVNTAFAHMFGFNSPEAAAQGIPDVAQTIYAHPESRAYFVQHVLEHSGMATFETEYRRRDGTSFTGLLRLQALRSAKDQSSYLFGFVENVTERRLAEQSLRESQQILRSIIENIPVRVFWKDRNSKFLGCNLRFALDAGFETPEEIIGKNDDQLSWKEQAESFQADDQTVIATGQPKINYEELRTTPNGHPVWLQRSKIPLLDAEGKVRGVVGTYEDITERKKGEQTLRDSEERYRSLFEDSPISLWEEDFSAVKLFIEILRGQGIADFRAYFKSHPEQITRCIEKIKVVDVNQAALKLFGAKSKAEIPVNLNLLIPGEAHEEFREELINIAEGKSEFEWQGINHTLTGERRVVDMRWSVAPGHEDTLDKVLLSMMDVTERKRAEEQVEILSKIPDESPNPIMRATSEGILLYANRASALLLAIWKTQVGQGLPDEWREMIKNVFDSGLYQEVEIQGGEKVYSLILAPIVDAGYVNLYGREITQRKQAEEALVLRTNELRQRNDELDRLYRATGSLLSSTPLEAQALAKTIVEVVQQEFGQANCSVFLIGKDSNDLDRLAVAGPYADQVSKIVLSLDGTGQVAQAIRSGQVINTPDVRASSAYVPSWEMASSELTIPLKLDDQVIGAIDVQSAEPGAFQPDDERLMSIFAERAALALERGRLNEELERRLQQLTTLRTIDMAISSSMDINLTLGILLEQAVQTLGVHAADVLIFNPVTQSFLYSTGQGFRTQALQHTDLRLGDGYAGQAARDRRVVSIRDLPRNTGGLQRSADFRREGFVSYVGAPLIAKGQVKGVLEIFQRSPFDPNQEQRAFLEMLASQAAIAIDSAQLFENLQGSNSELMMAYDETIEGWSRAMDLRDKETEGHTQRVTELTLRLANTMGFKPEELVHIRRGTLLHDIGKMGVPDEILRKPGALTDEEWMIMRKHPQFAYDMLAPIIYLRPAIDIPYCHHEKWDGTGYPQGLKGEQIPLEARIFALVDVWDALSSDRPYRKAWPEDRVRQYIQEQAGKHFDPHIVKVFLKEVSNVE